VYGNEDGIGAALREIVNGAISREGLWVTSKLWNDKQGEGDVPASCKQSLVDLQLA
jgi:alcohol dehydrogenase (NADP+)